MNHSLPVKSNLSKLLCNLLCLLSVTPILSIFAQKHTQSQNHIYSDSSAPPIFLALQLRMAVLEICCNFAMAVQFSSNLCFPLEISPKWYTFSLKLHSRVLKFLRVLRFRSVVQETSSSLFCDDATTYGCYNCDLITPPLS